MVLVNYVKIKLLSWFGHTNTMPETSIVWKIYKWELSTSKPVGRSKSRWEDEVRSDLRKLKLVKWAGQVQDRPKWKDIVKNAETVPEL